MSRRIVIVDTSVFLNILDVPGRNQHRDQTLNAVESHVWNGDHLYLPVPCIIETGNHIARLPNGHHRYRFAQDFVAAVTEAARGAGALEGRSRHRRQRITLQRTAAMACGFPTQCKAGNQPDGPDGEGFAGRFALCDPFLPAHAQFEGDDHD